MGYEAPGPLAVFCAAVDAERERAGLTKAFVGRQLGLSPATMTELFKGQIEKAPPWERIARILELCWDATNRPHPAGDERAEIRALVVRRREYFTSWRIRHGILEHELQAVRPKRPGRPPLPTPTIHYGHTLLGSMPLVCRAEDLVCWPRTFAGSADRSWLSLPHSILW